MVQWSSLAAVFAVVLGCAEDTSIREYRVAKSETQRNTAAAGLSATAAPAKEQLMLAAIVPNQDFAWFFKLTGDPEKVLESDAEFRSMVKSVAFDGAGQPTWKLHEGWQQQITPDAITYGKLTNDEAGLTATVTRLPFTSSATEDSWRGYIVSNINRWRNQLSLGQQEWEQMSGELEEFPELSQGPAKAYFVSIAGTGSGGMAAPFMNRGAGSPSATASPESAATASESTTDGSPTASSNAGPTSASSDKPISYTVPEGWQETAASGMRMASFAIGQAEAAGEVTVIAAGGGIEANIGIWLGQVGVEADAETSARILAESQEVAVNSLPVKIYTIGGPATAPTATPAAGEGQDTAQAGTEPESILIADIPWRDGQSLFVKFKGPSSLADAQREAFIEFVKSIEWN